MQLDNPPSRVYNGAMRDLKIVTTSDNLVDIDVVDGEALWLDEESQTTDQRAAIAVYEITGSIPGALTIGVPWGGLYNQQNTALELSNAAQQQIDQWAGQANADTMLQTTTTYQTLMLQQDGELGVVVMRGGK